MRFEDLTSEEVRIPLHATEAHCPNATIVYATDSTALTTLTVPNATHVEASGCTALTTLTVPNATHVDARGCPLLTATWKRDRLVRLLKAGGHDATDVVRNSWGCHDWRNCPMHEVFGVAHISKIPAEWRYDASYFVSVFDAKELPQEEVLKLIREFEGESHAG
jgi:hypothetical protein